MVFSTSSLGCSRVSCFYACVLLVVTSLPGCSRETPQEKLDPGQKSITLNGVVKPYRSISITAPISARVAHILVEEGDRVDANATLLEFESTLLRTEVARSEAAIVLAREHLKAAKRQALELKTRPPADKSLEAQRLAQIHTRNAAYRQASIRLENAKANLERLYPLLPNSTVSKREVDLAENEYADASYRIANLPPAPPPVQTPPGSVGFGNVEAAAAALTQAEAQLAEARYKLGQARLTAPISGVVTQVNATIGNVAYQHSPLFEIRDIERVRVDADLSPGLLPFVYPGQRAEIVINTTPSTTLVTKVERVSTVADPETQFLTLSLTVDNPDFRFQPGYSARVELSVDPTTIKPDVPDRE